MSIVRAFKLLHQDQQGLFSVSHLANVLFLTIVLLSIINMAISLSDRQIQQRQADAVAESLGNWKARNLNAVVAQQHLMGELLSLVIAHHAIGGDLLDKQDAANTTTADRKLKLAYLAARACQTGTPAYEDVSSKVLAEEALLKSHLKLKRLLTIVYQVKAVAMAMQAFPPTYPAGVALENAAHLLENWIHAEWKVLERIRRTALSLTPLKLKMLHQWLPKAKLQLDRMIADYTTSQRKLADELESRLEVAIHILPSDQSLPLIEDPLARLFQPPANWVKPSDCQCPTEPADNMRHQLVKVSQLARATFPWVNYHRRPLIAKMRPLTLLSGMADNYFDHTAGVSKNMMDDLQKEGQLALYCLQDYEGPDKAYEPWMKVDGVPAADKTFGLTVLIGKDSRIPIADRMFRRQPGLKNYRIATAFTWNRQVPEQPDCRIDLYCKRIVPSTQAKTSWDTLNWHPEATVHELVGFGIPHHFPSITPTWTSRLSVTSPARYQQLIQQELPAWATSLVDVLPEQVDSELLGL